MIFERFLECFLVILALTSQLCLSADSGELGVPEKNNADERLGEDYYDGEDDMDDGSDYNYDGYEEIEQLEDDIKELEEDEYEDGGDYNYENEDEIDEEFEYFYNQEMLGKLEKLEEFRERNSENISEDSLLMLVPEEEEDYEDSTELDIILDELLKEEELIDEVLDDFEEPLEMPEVSLTETSTSGSLLTKALFLTSLVSVVVMVFLSICYTASAIYYRKVATDDGGELEEKKPENPIIRSNKKLFWMRQKGNDTGPPEWV